MLYIFVRLKKWENSMVSVNGTKRVINLLVLSPKQFCTTKPNVIQMYAEDVATKLKYAPKFRGDIINLSGEALSKTKEQRNIFSRLEQDLIDQIKLGEIEDGRIIDKNGNFVENIKFIGTKYGCIMDTQHLLDLDLYTNLNLNDATFIHNHPMNAPLSTDDIYYMAKNKLKKIIACTSDGGYSIMERKVPVSEMNYSKFIDNAKKLNSEEIRQMGSLGKIMGITDIQRLELLNKWRYEKFGALAKEFGLEFKNNISPLNKESNLEGNLFSVNPIQRLIDRIIIICRNLGA